MVAVLMNSPRNGWKMQFHQVVDRNVCNSSSCKILPISFNAQTINFSTTPSLSDAISLYFVALNEQSKLRYIYFTYNSYIPTKLILI